jgi:hypothetical protein
MKLKTLIDVLTDTQPIHIYVSGNDDFEIHATRLGSIPKKVLVTMWDSGVVGIFADDKETLLVVLKGDDGDDKSD